MATGVLRWSDKTIDGAVAGLAGWTLVFHLARWGGLNRDVALVLWIVLMGVWLAIRLRVPADERQARTPSLVGNSKWTPGVRTAVAGLLCVAALLSWVTVDGLWWPLVWAVLVAFLAVIVRGVLAGVRTSAGEQPVGGSRLTPAATMSVVVLALGMALLSLVMVRPDQDDVFVVNRSTWIAEHDQAFPDRDTVFSDDFLPSQRPAGLPTSLEAFVGSVAAATKVTASTLSYLVLAPLVAALGVLATWRLLRSFGARSPVLATWVAMSFLVLDGVEHGSFGNFSVGRSWQGKVAFLVLVVPTLWHHAAAWGATGQRRSLRATALGVLAGLGLTSTAVLVTPAVVVAASLATTVAVSLGREGLRRLAWALVATMPVILTGLVTLLSEPQRLNELAGVVGDGIWAAFDPLRWFDSGTEPVEVLRMVFGSGLVTFVALVAALLAWTAGTDRQSRLLLLAGPTIVFTVFLAPGFLDVLNELGEADAVAWRVAWVLPIPAMVGLFLTAPRPEFGQGLGARAPLIAPLIVLGVLAASGTAITSPSNRGTELVWPPSLDLPRPEVDGARGLVDRAPDGGLVAGPEDVDFAVSVLTSKVKTVNPRSAYLTGRHVGEEFLAEDRRVLSHALDHGWAEWGAAAVTQALDGLQPDAVCLKTVVPYGNGAEVEEILVGAGYRRDGSNAACRFFVRSDFES